MTFGSLFAGIGGLDLGLERAGMVCKWQVEIDPYCQAVLAKHWPDVPRWDDATTFPPDAEGHLWGTPWHDGRIASDWRGVDLVCGGFPCQPVSQAGKRGGTADPRWLWPEFERIVRVLRPRYVLVENVPGILTANRGDAMGEVLGGLAALGYDAEWQSIPAAAVGAPHLRWRVFIVAYAQGFTGQVWSAERERPWRLTGGGFGSGNWWTTEPNVGRVAHGVPARVDRLRSLGNAVVPQVAEWIGRKIVEAEGVA